jgi:hypothetical protein
MVENNSEVTKQHPNPEELTYREGVQRGSDSNFASVDRRFDQFDRTLKEFVSRAEEKAQTANDALQALLEANLTTIIKVTDQGLENTREAMRHVETRIGHAREIASAAVDNVDNRALLRQSATTEILEARVVALTEISELRAEVNRMAIGKAEQTLERRLDAISEFNSVATNNEKNYVTRSVLDAQLERITSQTGKLQSYVSIMQSKLFIGGLALLFLQIVAQIVMYRYGHGG